MLRCTCLGSVHQDRNGIFWPYSTLVTTTGVGMTLHYLQCLRARPFPPCVHFAGHKPGSARYWYNIHRFDSLPPTSDIGTQAQLSRPPNNGRNGVFGTSFFCFQCSLTVLGFSPVPSIGDRLFPTRIKRIHLLHINQENTVPLLEPR